MDKTLSLFRVFDIAFFAPGLMMYWLMRKVQWLPEPLGSLDSSITKAEGVLALVTMVGLVYVLGLLVHGVQEFVQPAIQCTPTIGSSSPWYDSLVGNPQADLATYFWYMRTTCWNLATASVISIIVLLFYRTPNAWWLIVLALVLWQLGRNFDRALRRAANASGRLRDSK